MKQAIGFGVGVMLYTAGLGGHQLNYFSTETLHALIIFGAGLMIASYFSSALGQKAQQAQSMLRILFFIASVVIIFSIADRYMDRTWKNSGIKQ